MKTNLKFGNTIRGRREAFGYTQHELARLIGVSGAHIAYMESGKRLPSLDVVFHLAEVLNLRPAKLALKAFPILAEFGVE